MLHKVAGILFFISWLLCGCSIDQALDDWRAAVVAVITLITAVLSAAVLGWRDDK